jgi:DNA-binding response OmpR family regulator
MSSHQEPTVKPSRAPLNALVVVANPNGMESAFGRVSLPGIETRMIQPAELRRDPARARADVLVVDGATPNCADFIAFMRSSLARLPILFVAEHLGDVAAAMAAGASDFATPAATPAELGIRIQLLASGVVRPLPQIRPIGSLTLDREARLLANGSKSVGFSPIECKMFERLLLEVGRPVSRAELERSVWGQGDMTERATNVAVVYVSYLRRKLAVLGDACVIRTITNVGYALELRDAVTKPLRARARV